MRFGIGWHSKRHSPLDVHQQQLLQLQEPCTDDYVAAVKLCNFKF